MIDQRYIFEAILNNTPSHSVKKTKGYPYKMIFIQLKTSGALLREKFKLVDAKLPAKINFIKLFFLVQSVCYEEIQQFTKSMDEHLLKVEYTFHITAVFKNLSSLQ